MIEETLKKAKLVAPLVASLSEKEKNDALYAMADELISETENILKANEQDLLDADFLSDVMKDRLRLSEDRIIGMADGMRQIATLSDPVGRVLQKTVNKAGLEIKRVSVPFGVVAVIFESRPNVSADTAALCLKSGNVSVLRGGKESYRSCLAIVSALKKGLKKCNLNPDFIKII